VYSVLYLYAERHTFRVHTRHTVHTAPPVDVSDVSSVIISRPRTRRISLRDSSLTAHTRYTPPPHATVPNCKTLRVRNRTQQIFPSALLRPGAHVVRIALTEPNARVDVVAVPFPAGPAEVLFVVVVLVEDVDAVGLPLLARLFARLEELILGEDEVARVPPHL